jgi:hypothetical protein
MSKVLEKESTLLNNLSGTEIANELDSRLRDLEKNIAVAREFIKLADESYSELRHKWNLLHEEVRNKPETNSTGRAIVADEKRETRPQNKKQSKPRETEVTELNQGGSPSSTDISEKPEVHPRRVPKTTNRPKKKPEISGKDTDSILSEKPSQPYRDPGRRRGRTSGRN